jgi:hypothetical protein
MTVIRYWTVRVKPGAFDTAVGLLREAAKLEERHGATQTRLSRGIVAGANSDTLVFSCEFPDFEAFGGFADSFISDAEYDAYQSRARAADAPFSLLSSALATELAVDRANPKAERGEVIDAYTFRVLPGRLSESMNLAKGAFEVFDNLGASRCRLFEEGTGGDQAGLNVSIIDFDSMRNWGRVRDAFLADPAARTVMETASGAGSPIQPISHSVYCEVHL